MRVPSWILALCVLVSSAVAAPPPVIEKGTIEGANYTWLRPAGRWNRSVLLVAHGFRAESADLVADLSPEHAAYRRLADEGWLVAKTSYRRNGLILLDAMRDLDNLRAEIVKRFGAPERVLVEGDSMGGMIALLLAERPPETPRLYDGVVAVDAALGLREPDAGFSGLSMQPQIPVVFLCNRNEIEAARHYRELDFPAGVRPFPPALLRVDRDGHVNVNQAERLFALRYLNQWLDSGLPEPVGLSPEKGYVDATRIPEPLPSRVFVDADGLGFVAHVSEISAIFGNILLDAQPADFVQIGLKTNAYFEVTLRDHSYRVLFGKEFGSARHGEWVAFPNADGFYWLGRNKANAAATTQCELGDLVHVRRYVKQKAES